MKSTINTHIIKNIPNIARKRSHINMNFLRLYQNKIFVINKIDNYIFQSKTQTYIQYENDNILFF